MKTTSSIEVEKYISGVDYPADKKAVLKYAKDKNASNDVVDMLNKIPDREYTNSSDVSSEIELSEDEKGEEDADLS